ncbi:amino acid decarboxylase [Mycobacterium sp. 1245111.1]|uniref:Y4yA family PLP-dependent enzyme n=1 Tax=Mycobacterium sp. 1245111.1 TaxID=1834073 RepID=UPI0007FE7418|nr:Y4yA family PLP-dependent enzyme [Mycobacterium sp. 1245111.1]OBK35183.1 amino acid decarboxylase [Mycobacterium sp. 1245111.1]
MELTHHTVSLKAFEPQWCRGLRADPQLLGDIHHAVGGPFHVLYPPRFAQNLRAFTEVIAAAGIPGQVYFAKKANKALCWLRECAHEGAGVDVASVPELTGALGHGVRGADIVVTGPAKSDELLWLAARHDALIAVDALDELDRVIALGRGGLPARILLRVCPDVNPDSRFGLSFAELHTAAKMCRAEQPRVLMQGVSFHLNGYEVAPRARLADQLIDLLLKCRTLGLPATSLSIGGGFAVSYLDATTWTRFQHEHRDTDFHTGKTFTHFYPYHQSVTGAAMLAAILASPTASGHKTLGDKLAHTRTTLLIEPGRALLDGAGVTVFPVQGFKRRADYGITTVAGLSMSLSEQWKSSEFLPDPALWPDYDASTPVEVRSCVAGASCLEYDMISWRKIGFTREPRPGDLLIYPNTAGYQMDKNESAFHDVPLPPKIVLTDAAGRFRWRLDRTSPHL